MQPGNAAKRRSDSMMFAPGAAPRQATVDYHARRDGTGLHTQRSAQLDRLHYLDEELAWLSSLGDSLPPRGPPRAHRSAATMDLLDWSQHTESDIANLRSDADWRTCGPSSDAAGGALATQY